MIPLIRSASPALADFAFEKLDLGEIVSQTSQYLLRYRKNDTVFLCSHQESGV